MDMAYIGVHGRGEEENGVQKANIALYHNRGAASMRHGASTMALEFLHQLGVVSQITREVM